MRKKEQGRLQGRPKPHLKKNKAGFNAGLVLSTMNGRLSGLGMISRKTASQFSGSGPRSRIAANVAGLSMIVSLLPRPNRFAIVRSNLATKG
jgi:hypothetical protein